MLAARAAGIGDQPSEVTAEFKAASAAIIASVDATEESVTAAQQAIADFVEAGGAPVVGQTFVLTDAVGENIVGTANNDTFSAVSGTDGTLNVADTIDGGAGTDTLNIVAVAGSVGLPAGASISNVEIININQSAANFDTALDARDFGAAAQQIWQIGAAVDITGLAAGQTAGFRDVTSAAADVDLSATFSGATGNIALDGVESTFASGNVNIDVAGSGTGGNILRTVNISGDVAADGAVVIDDIGGTDTVRTLNLSLSEDITLDVDGVGALRTLNASGSTGDITVAFDLATTVDLTTITLGSGADDVVVNGWTAANNDALTINLGAGADTLELAGVEAGSTITGGAGADVFTFLGLANLTEDEDIAAEFEDQIISITDFTNDVLDLNFGADPYSQTLVNDAIAGLDADATLADAIEAISTVTGWASGEWAIFQFDGSTYVYADDSDVGLSDGDGLLQLVGFTGTLTQGDNLFV